MAFTSMSTPVLKYPINRWYHKVSQTAGTEGFACAVNYWYDMDFTGQFWTTNHFIREVAEAKKRIHSSLPHLDDNETLRGCV